MAVLTRGEALRRIVERTDLELFTERVLDSFWAQPAFQRLHPAGRTCWRGSGGTSTWSSAG